MDGRVSAAYRNLVVTLENIEELQEFAERRLKVGDVYLVRLEETVDLRPFGQLRTWLGDPPSE